MEVKGKVEKRKSKAGNDYFCVVIKLTDTYEKIIFLDKAELELIQLTLTNSK